MADTAKTASILGIHEVERRWGVPCVTRAVRELYPEGGAIVFRHTLGYPASRNAIRNILPGMKRLPYEDVYVFIPIPGGAEGLRESIGRIFPIPPGETGYGQDVGDGFVYLNGNPLGKLAPGIANALRGEFAA